MYVQDNINVRNWSFNLGIRGDMYNGLATASQAEPRVGICLQHSEDQHRPPRLLRAHLETPFNENLVLSSVGCASDVLNPLLGCSSSTTTPLQPGFRNEFHAGLQQAIGKFLVIDGEYIWKYTHSAYDFSMLGNTPIFFPIEWHNSKIPGFALRASMPVISRLHRAGGHVQRRCALLHSPDLGSRRHSLGAHGGLPHRSRRSLQHDRARAIPDALEARAMVWLQLALRQRTGRRRSALLRNLRLQRLPAIDRRSTGCPPSL